MAKATVAAGIADGSIIPKAGDLTAFMKMENLYTGGPTERIDAPSATLNNIVIMGDNGTEKIAFENEEAGAEEIGIIEKYLKLNGNGVKTGRPVNRIKKPKPDVSK